MTSSNSVSLTDISESSILRSLQTPLSATGTSINNYTTTATWPWYSPTYYTYTYPTIQITVGLQVNKVENGFTLTQNNKTWVAKNEQEVARLMVKIFEKEGNK